MSAVTPGAQARGEELTMATQRAHRSALPLIAVAGLTLGSPSAAREPVVFEAGPDWDIVVSGQVRPRFYAHSGNDFRGDASEWREVVTQRARLGVMAEEASGLALAVELQDVRVWGEEDDTLADASAGGLDVRQAFAYLPLYDTLSLKLGRQEISWDDERLVGAVAWSQRGRTFDGARVQWSGLRNVLAVDAIYAKIQETGQSPEGAVPPGRSGDVDFTGLRTSVEYYPEHEIVPSYLLRSNRAADELRHTTGLAARGRASGLRYGAEVHYQLGEIGGQSIEALLAALSLSYTVDVPQAPRLTLWGEMLSGGEGDAADTFDTLYATNHDFYGEMDFFLDIPAHTAGYGLVDVGGRIGTNVVEPLRVHADFHHFRTEDATPSGDQVLGHEVDVALRWEIHDHVAVRTLYGVFLPGEAMRDIKAVTAPTLLLPSNLEPDHLVFVTTDVAF